MNLKHIIIGFFASMGIAYAFTTGPYGVFDSFNNYDTFTYYFNQGQVNTVVNQTIACSVVGPGLNLVNAHFLFQANFHLPSRLNDSVVLVAQLSSRVRVGIPSTVTSYFAKAGSSSLTVSNNTLLSLKFSGSVNGSAVSTYPIRDATMQDVRLTGASYTIVSLNGYFEGFIPLGGPGTSGSSRNLLAAIPSRRLIIQRDRLTFSLSAAGKTADVTCAAGARAETFGFTNIADLPAYIGIDTKYSIVTRPGDVGDPPINSTVVASSYKPNCTFSGIGRAQLGISLGGVKSNRPISTMTPGIFGLGQSNFLVTPKLVKLFQTKYPSTNTVSLKLSAFNVSISNATPSIKNLLPAAGYPASAKVGSGGFATFPSAAPSVTYPSATFTPIASSIGKGQLAFLSYDNVAGSVKLFDANSTAIATVAFSCSEGAGNFPSIVPFDIA
ncbi:hypothetical protein A4X13_0g9052 [Tilletia indica]|uniref:Peptidase A1 domain-containing protein n=1 Tax=Tilletia indica TaxID=43049 RepID=A0A8T8SBM3_9BASI|nr:hypothetical protein A4X13_0g9052 [Tilletia indica]